MARDILIVDDSPAEALDNPSGVCLGIGQAGRRAVARVAFGPQHGDDQRHPDPDDEQNQKSFHGDHSTEPTARCGRMEICGL